MPSAQREHSGFVVKFLAFIIVSAVCFGILELGAGFIWKTKYNELLATQLHGYDRVDYDRGIIVPVPNTVMTVADYRANLIDNHKTVGLKHFQADMQNQGLTDDDVLFQVNSFGFKGPDIALPKPSNTFRIVTIGDSCTWGSDQDYFTYPRALERALKQQLQAAGCPLNVEVVNAGVLGYNYERVLQRIDEYLAVEPDLVTLYLGWNRTIGRADPKKNLSLYRNLALYRIFYHFVINRSQAGITENYASQTYYQPEDPALEDFKDYNFDHDLHDLNTLVDIIHNHNPQTQIALMTIGGLLDWRLEPDTKALDIAYPIASTNNLYAYPLLTKRYNEQLRDYAQQHRNIKLIDFEQHAFEHFNPRSEFFIDSVHPTSAAYIAMGVYFADALAPLLNACEKIALNQ